MMLLRAAVALALAAAVLPARAGMFDDDEARLEIVKLQKLIAAQKEPDKYRNLTIRVAGYTAYFTELAVDLQNEIIARTSYEDS